MPTVLVTGASRGIGLSITRHLGERGWEVYATARSADDLRALGRIPHVHPVQLDVTDRSAVARLPEQVDCRQDRLDDDHAVDRPPLPQVLDDLAPDRLAAPDPHREGGRGEDPIHRLRRRVQNDQRPAVRFVVEVGGGFPVGSSGRHGLTVATRTRRAITARLAR